jgi:hypothetical protein
MDELLARVWDDLVGRVGGPMTFRLIVQPIVASLLAVRAGRRDARAGRPPYLWGVFTESGRRWELVGDGWRDTARVFLAAIVIDAVYQYLVLRWIYPVEALIVAFALAVIPYAAIRGPVTRLARWRLKSRTTPS